MKEHIKKPISLIILLSVSLSCIMACANKEKQIITYINQIIDNYQVPGMAIAIVQDDEIYVAKAFGVKSLETNEPVKTSSIFHMASVSKPFAATAILQLVEKGDMKLDDPLVKYLPYLKLDDPRYRDITIKQMLTHTSGIPDVNDYEWDKPQFDDGAAERYVRSLQNEKMIAGPGEKWQYSNMAFDILADVIAKVSGQTFEDYVKEQILDPLEMFESDFLRERIKTELRTTAHVYNLEPQVSPVYPYNRRHAPSSCLNANVLEMCHWAIANMNRGEFNGNRILKTSSYDLLFEPQAQINENRSVGLSWFISTYRERKTVAHSGGDLGYRSQILMLPEESLAVLVAANYDMTPAMDVAIGLIDIMLGFEPQQPKIPILLTIGKTIVARGVDQAIEHYRDLKRSTSDGYDFSESQLNRLGYQLISNERLDDAIKIFELNVEMFPEAYNTYDSLAEAYLKNGDKKLAIQNYRKSIELNPDNSNAIKMLAKLEEYE